MLMRDGNGHPPDTDKIVAAAMAEVRQRARERAAREALAGRRRDLAFFGLIGLAAAAIVAIAIARLLRR